MVYSKNYDLLSTLTTAFPQKVINYIFINKYHLRKTDTTIKISVVQFYLMQDTYIFFFVFQCPDIVQGNTMSEVTYCSQIVQIYISITTVNTLYSINEGC